MLSLQLSEQGELPWYPGTSLGRCLFMPLLTFLAEPSGVTNINCPCSRGHRNSTQSREGLPWGVAF